MNKKETVSLWISIFAGIFAAFLIFSYTQEKTKEISKIFGKQTTVVIANQVIYEMQTIQENMVELVEIPEKFVQPGYARQIEDVVGLVALAPINKGEQMLTNKVILPGPETGLSLQVTPGKRAISIPVSKTRAVSYLLKPGDRVDMLVATDLNLGTSQKRYIKTLLQDIIILATGMRVVSELPRLQEEVGGEVYIKNLRKETEFDTITIEASPSDAQKITYLLSTDPQSIFFTLRHSSDNETVILRQTELADVLGAGLNRAPAQRRPNLTR